MDKKMLDLITKILDGFENDKLILNIPRIQSIPNLAHGSFENDFVNAMNEFRNTKPDKPYDATLDIIFEEAKKKNPHLNFEYICERFYEQVLEAKAHDVIIDKPIFEEFEKYKEKCLELENEVGQLHATIQQLREEKIVLQTTIKIHEKMYPTLKGIGDGETGDVKEDE